MRKVNDNVKVLRVRSPTLTSLGIKYYLEGEFVEILTNEDFDYKQSGVLIDAPRLKYLNLEDEVSYIKTISNSGSLTKVNILGEFELKDSDDQFRKFFTSFSRVRDMKISYNSFWYITNTVPLPQFCNLSCLVAELAILNLETLLTLFGSCPNLRSLVLDLDIIDAYVEERMRLLPVPLCLLSSLEFVEIKRRFNGDPIVELARYFAENSVILKKLVLRLAEENPVVLCDFFASLRRSSKCQIIVC